MATGVQKWRDYEKAQPQILDRKLDQSPMGLIESKDGLEKTRTHNNGKHHIVEKIQRKSLNTWLEEYTKIGTSLLFFFFFFLLQHPLRSGCYSCEHR